VAVNLSVRNLLDPKLPETLGGLLLARSDVNPAWLTLEITESVLMADPERAMNTLLRLRRLGTRLAIDDFGTGYSSLTYLQRLPVDEVKIDRSFVMGMTGGESSAAIVRTTIDLAHTLGFEAVAEGVENQQAWDLLVEFGCDIVQGYYVSRPMPVSDIEAWLDRKSIAGNLLSA
jgi:EAL domain-containing protein (putative c-di-GMP-specific phosphodiesterase class I)